MPSADGKGGADMSANGPAAFRKRFPAAEARLPWLAALLSAYAVVDAEAARLIRLRQARDERLACRKGCARCCRQPVPATALEVMGLAWYAGERLLGRDARAVRDNLERTATLEQCVFLTNEACAVHPVRPIACRNYLVFNAPCAPNEDVMASRPADLLNPGGAGVAAAFRIMLPFSGLAAPGEIEKALAEGILYKTARLLRDMDWEPLARRLAQRGRGDGDSDWTKT